MSRTVRAATKITAALFTSEIEYDEIEVTNEKGKQEKRQVARKANLFAIRGRIVGHETGTTQFGEYVSFLGNFQAFSATTGEVVESPRAIFPGLVSDMVFGAYSTTKADDPSANVNIAFMIGVEPDKRAAVGYHFTCNVIKGDADVSDPLSAIKAATDEAFAEFLGDKAGVALLGTMEEPAKLAAPKGNKVKEPA